MIAPSVLGRLHFTRSSLRFTASQQKHYADIKMLKIEQTNETYNLAEALTPHWPEGKHSDVYPREIIRLAVPSHQRSLQIDLQTFQRPYFQKVYRELTTLRTKAIDNVGHLESELDKLLIGFLSRFPNECSRVRLAGNNIADEVKSLNFMQCRDKLSKLLKAHKELGGKNSKMTMLFCDAISERNKYAHGVFYFLQDYTPLLQYELKKKNVLGHVSIEHIKSFNLAVLDLLEWLKRLDVIARDLNELKNAA
jgi:hypothetical protein